MKIRCMGAELFHPDGTTDGRTDGDDEANSRFRSFANAPKEKDLRNLENRSPSATLTAVPYIWNGGADT